MYNIYICITSKMHLGIYASKIHDSPLASGSRKIATVTLYGPEKWETQSRRFL